MVGRTRRHPVEGPLKYDPYVAISAEVWHFVDLTVMLILLQGGMPLPGQMMRGPHAPQMNQGYPGGPAPMQVGPTSGPGASMQGPPHAPLPGPPSSQPGPPPHSMHAPPPTSMHGPPPSMPPSSMHGPPQPSMHAPPPSMAGMPPPSMHGPPPPSSMAGMPPPPPTMNRGTPTSMHGGMPPHPGQAMPPPPGGFPGQAGPGGHMQPGVPPSPGPHGQGYGGFPAGAPGYTGVQSPRPMAGQAPMSQPQQPRKLDPDQMPSPVSTTPRCQSALI